MSIATEETPVTHDIAAGVSADDVRARLATLEQPAAPQRPKPAQRQASATGHRRAAADASPPASPPARPDEDAERADLVDRIAEWAVEEGAAAHGEALLALKARIRAELGGRKHYVPSGQGSAGAVPEATQRAVLAMFNGRNVSEVARRLRIGRATVYRLIRQPGAKK